MVPDTAEAVLQNPHPAAPRSIARLNAVVGITTEDIGRRDACG